MLIKSLLMVLLVKAFVCSAAPWGGWAAGAAVGAPRAVPCLWPVQVPPPVPLCLAQPDLGAVRARLKQTTKTHFIYINYQNK